jgi:hypothetical protein
MDNEELKRINEYMNEKSIKNDKYITELQQEARDMKKDINHKNKLIFLLMDVIDDMRSKNE